MILSPLGTILFFPFFWKRKKEKKKEKKKRKKERWWATPTPPTYPLSVVSQIKKEKEKEI